MTGLTAQDWVCLGEGSSGAPATSIPWPSGCWCAPVVRVGVILVRAGVCPSHPPPPEYFVFIMVFLTFPCWLQEEFEEKRQKNVFELRNTSWKSNSQKQLLLYFAIVWKKIASIFYLLLH